MNESPKRGLLAAYRQLLNPLLRILIRNSVVFDEFSEIAKRAYLDAAAEAIRTDKYQKLNDDLTELTGLSAEEIEAVIDRGKQDEVDSYLNEIAVTLTGWHTDSNFTGPYGVPLELQLDDTSGIDFKKLVRKYVGNDSLAETLLNELVRVGTVIETEPGWYRATSRFYIPEGTAPTGIEHLARSVSDFVTTIDFNAQESDPKKRRFERQTYTTDGIRPEDLRRFEEYAYSKSQLLLEEIDNWVSQLDVPDAARKEKIVTGIGIYHYISTEESSN